MILLMSGVSVVIPTYNATQDHFELLLTMLINQVGFRKIEIIMVDSGSNDGTVKLARKFGVSVIEIPLESFSHSFSRNLGAAQASMENILFISQDILPTSNQWLMNLYCFAEKHAVVAVSCTEIPRYDADFYYKVNYALHYNRFLLMEDGEDRILCKPKEANHQLLRRNACLSNVACLIKRDVFEKYKFRQHYAEDLDLGLRLINDGYRLGLMSSEKVIHSHNRPASYHLKRAFVDTVTLASYFPDFPRETVANLKWCTYHTLSLLNQLVDVHLSKFRFPCKTEEIFKVIGNRQERSREKTDFNGTCKYADSAFLDYLHDAFGLDYWGKQPNAMDGPLQKKMKKSFKNYETYLSGFYHRMDEHIYMDFIWSIYKELASHVGRLLAFEYLKKPEVFEETAKQLSKGI